MNRFAIVVLGLLGLAAAGGAQAQSSVGYAATNANLRAGPDTGYPRVSTVPAGASLDIYGCVDDWSWCDVAWRGERGWMSAALIEYDSGGSRYYVDDRGASLGLPILTFALDIYWADHYLRRPWYHQRDHWSHYRPPPRPRPSHPSHGGSHRPPQVSQPGGHARPPSRPSGGQHQGGGQHRPAQRPGGQQHTTPRPGGHQQHQQHQQRPATRPAGQHQRPAPSRPAGSHSGKPQPHRPAADHKGKPHGDHHPA